MIRGTDAWRTVLRACATSDPFIAIGRSVSL
jgi:hypothetical protein